MNEIVLNMTCLSWIPYGKRVSSCQSTHENSVITYLKNLCKAFHVTVWLVSKSLWKSLSNDFASGYQIGVLLCF